MPEFFYQIVISVAAFAFRIAALFSPKIKLGLEGRRNVFSQLENALRNKPAARPVAWFHAASLGEFEQGRPVIEALRQSYPDYFIVLTFFSPSGYEVRKHYSGADHICYLPLDTRANAMQFVKIVNPRIAFFIKYEFWFNYLKALRENGSRIISFSAKFRPGQIFFKPYGGFFRKILRYFDQLFVQNQESVDLLQQAGIMHSHIAGDTRFDRVKMIAAQAPDLAEMRFFVQHKPCLVAGSVWEADMQVLIPVLNQLGGSLQAIIAPHEIHPEEIRQWRQKLTGTSVLYSELRHAQELVQADYLIVDNIGLLSALYRYGSMAYIGGSFGTGLHNILEAATFGLPIAFGNRKYSKFQEAADLTEQGGAVAVADARELSQVLDKWVRYPQAAFETGAVNKSYVASGAGSTELIMQTVRQMLA
ncbi:3-deoxy-D-manno-octulosonic acid transferase [Dyadobacter sandarakinus]|uniref:3-deoxy-D-manno-octulosonic acid transferase n=1 Tax=Dyadobacter sandarakinus TaxID=2747268 RepID=A0ABX7I7S4_9BACT|nr:glycosyltransferase N-terminal domain-containing protein [Dyadobacter sandarakinus]QRR02139.1 3-deoxy-D-manno-octulosonic acid transferase [Dyadobacter sandarakinus]